MQITAEQIKQARLAVGETQATFAERFGVHQTTVHNWEINGAPTDGTAGKAIERVLGEIMGQTVPGQPTGPETRPEGL